jgi:extracellular elastinolytic metalloproteinase
MGFGPVHPHAKFHTSPVSYAKASVYTSDPYEVARSFVTELLQDQLSADNEFALRKDSYTDKATGVTHVHFRQMVNGIEVADGDINVNVKGGTVISYGDSFYHGNAPGVMFMGEGSFTPDPHAEFCGLLREQLVERLALVQERAAAANQITMATARLTDEPLERMEPIFRWNCDHVRTPYHLAEKGFGTPSDVFDPRSALLQFMIAATPNDAVVANILDNHDQIVAGMTSWFEPHLVGDNNAVLVEMIKNVPDTVSPVKAKPVYIQLPDGDKTMLMQAWRFEVEMEDNWYEAIVSRQAPHRILSVVDWASDSPIPSEPSQRPPATYHVFPFGINDPSEGDRSYVKENFDTLASPLGWHVIPVQNDPLSSNLNKKGYSNYTTTFGNNVFAHENWGGQNNWLHNYRPDGSDAMVFDYPYKPKVTDKSDSLDEAKKYINTTVAQLFYTSNLVHDLYYRYGFDEVSGNFQQHNFGRGGEEGDAVIANAQDGSGFNNANFMTPPDGQNGRCRMYLWNTAIPYRDGDLEAGIVIHELTHGLSIRLTGGPANSGCLGWGESGGMGEGWGDFLATIIRSNAEYSDYPMGAWAANETGGIRIYPYSLDKSINPSTYKTLDGPQYWGVHAIGEVWAEILWVVAQRLIKKHGFVESLFPPSPLEDGSIPLGDFYRVPEFTSSDAPSPLVPKHGNSLIVQLVMNAMKLQQCRPSFFDARDAVIQADQVLTGGENYCDIWYGFAEKGLGVDAKVQGRTPWGGGVRTDGYSVPAVCRAPEPFPTPEPKPDEPTDDEPEDDWPWSLFRVSHV